MRSTNSAGPIAAAALTLVLAAGLQVLGTAPAVADVPASIKIVQAQPVPAGLGPGNPQVPIAGALVKIERNSTSQDTPFYIQTKTTGSNGIAAFTGLTWGGYYIISVGKSGCQFVQQDQNLTATSNKPTEKTMWIDCAGVSGRGTTGRPSGR